MQYKKLNIILSFMLIIISTILSSNVYAHTNENDWWLCTHEGHSLPSGRICESACCIVCISDSPRDCFSFPPKPSCSCNFDDGDDDQTPPELTLVEPEEGSLHDSRTIRFNIISSETSKIEMSINDEKFKSLCTSCAVYNRRRVFVEGNNDILIRATDPSGNANTLRTNFMVDSKKPSITSIKPSSGYADGNFEIKYTEQNIESVTINIRGENQDTFTQFNVDSCPSGSRMTCTTTLDLAVYDGQEIEYYFTITDPIRSVSSRKKKVDVDVTPPTMTLVEPSSSEYTVRRIPIHVELSEKLSKLYYTDNGGSKKLLCSRCSRYDSSRLFSSGSHTLDIFGEDFGGNEVGQMVLFNII